jgi:hypothetical protein
MCTVDKVDGTKTTVLLGVTPCSLAERYQIDSYIRQSYNIQPTGRWKQQVVPKVWYHTPNCTVSHRRWKHCYLLPWKPQNSQAADNLKHACRIWGWKSNSRNCCWVECIGSPWCNFVVYLNEWKSFLKKKYMGVTEDISHLLWEPNVYYNLHQSSLLFPTVAFEKCQQKTWLTASDYNAVVDVLMLTYQN